MSPPWMPLYVADYLRDTRRLTAAEHGAYLLLIMEHWIAGSLPDDDRQLARIACMTDREWKASRQTIAAFFQAGWVHKRVTEELQKAATTISKRRAAAEEMHSKRRARADANAGAKAAAGHDIRAGTPSPSSSEASASGGEPPLPDSAIEKRALFERGKEVLGAKAGGLLADLVRAKGGNIALARAAVEQASQAQNPSEYVGRILHPKANGSHNDATSVHAAGQRLIERAREAERMQSELRGGGGSPDVRMLEARGRG